VLHETIMVYSGELLNLRLLNTIKCINYTMLNDMDIKDAKAEQGI
jgi:hypothetical protein